MCEDTKPYENTMTPAEERDCVLSVVEEINDAMVDEYFKVNGDETNPEYIPSLEVRTLSPEYWIVTFGDRNIMTFEDVDSEIGNEGFRKYIKDTLVEGAIGVMVAINQTVSIFLDKGEES